MFLMMAFEQWNNEKQVGIIKIIGVAKKYMS
jgi:hypothetical protein